MKNKIYIIDGKTYLNHINDEVHLYGLLHQLAFLAGRIKDEEDVFHVLDAAKRYGEIAEEKRRDRRGEIPGLGHPRPLPGIRRPQRPKGPYGKGAGGGHPGARGGAEAQEV